jgi:hypothetical protein
MADLATPAAEPTTEPVSPASTEAPASEPTGWMGNTGEFRDGTPDRIKALLDKKKWTTVEQLATGYEELEKFKGSGEHLVIPEAEDVDGWENIYNQLGRPETADKYEYTNEKGVALDDSLMGLFKEYAHKTGKTQSQFQGDIDFQIDAIAAQEEVYNQQAAEKSEADTAKLKQMYGINYETAMRDAGLTADRHNVSGEIEAEGLGNIPVVKQLLNIIANLEAEDGIGAPGGGAVEKSLDEQMSEIMASEAFKERFHKDHKTTMAKYMDLNRQIANSGGARASR